MTNILASIYLLVVTNESLVGTATYNTIPPKTYDIYARQIVTNRFLHFKFEKTYYSQFIESFNGPMLPEKKIEKVPFNLTNSWGTVWCTNVKIFIWTNDTIQAH